MKNVFIIFAFLLGQNLWACKYENIDIFVSCFPSENEFGFVEFTGKRLRNSTFSVEEKSGAAICKYSFTDWESTYTVHKQKKTFNDLEDLGDLANDIFESGLATWLPPALVQEPYLQTKISTDGNTEITLFLGLDTLSGFSGIANLDEFNLQSHSVSAKILDDTQYIEMRRNSELAQIKDLVGSAKQFHYITGTGCSITATTTFNE